MIVVAAALGACGPPRVNTLPGTTLAASQLPVGARLSGHTKIVFQWEMHDGEIIARGEGAARIASPDSIRMDFFLAGGFGSGAAILVGDSLLVPGPDLFRSLVPPKPLLWAALGRLVIPAERDTIVRVDGGTVRADIGTPARWRVTFIRDTLTRLERVEAGRLQEWVERTAEHRVQYRSESARRSLTLTITRTDAVAPFDPSIWRF